MLRYSAVIVLSLFVGLVHSDDFISEIKAKSKIYDAIDTHSNRALFFSGNHDEAVKELTGLVESKNVHDYLILGNMLYRMNPELSFQYHKKAYELAPNEWLTQLEMAMEFHRKGMFQQALSLYQKLDAQGKLSPPKQALIAHCYLVTNKLSSAIKHWSKADYPNNHNSIDFVIFEVFGNGDPTIQFSRLIERIKQGDQSAIDPAIELAVEWRTNWWNSKFNKEAYLVLEKLLEEKSDLNKTQLKEMKLFSLLRSEKSKPVILRELDNAGYIIDGKPLASSSFLNYRLMTIVLQNKVMSEKLIWRYHKKALERRVNGSAKDLYALKMQAHLLVKLEKLDELLMVDKKGWKEFKEIQFASSYLVDIARKEKDWPVPSALIYKQLYRDFPNEPFPLYYQLVASKKNKSEKRVVKDILVKLINAEYHGLKSSRPKYSDQLNGFYHELEKLVTSQ